MDIRLVPKSRAGLTIRGPHTNVRRGPFYHSRSQDFLWACTFLGGLHFSSPKKLTTCLVVVAFKRTCTEHSNIQTSKRHGKNLAVDRGPLAAGPPMVQPAQWLIRPCQNR